MPIYKFILPFITIFTLTFFTSCNKNEEETEPSKTDLLVGEEWQGNRILINGIDMSDRQEIKAMLLDIKSTRLTFRRDGTYTATYNDSEGSQTTTGTWKFSNNEAAIEFDLLGVLQIKNLTPQNFDLVASVEQGGSSYQPEVRFVRP